ncbi:MAG: DUF5989 family protein [Isosphaeraceae bacterium]
MPDERSAENFEHAAAAPEQSLPAELWGFLRQNKKWWLLPILVALAAMGLLSVAAATGAAPFLYTLF